MPRSLLIVVAACVVAAGPARATDAVPIVVGPGNQTAPSVSKASVAYLDDRSGEPQVVITSLATGAVQPVTADGLPHGAPDLSGTILVFAEPEGLRVVDLLAGTRRLVQGAGVARPSASGDLVAWEQAGAGGRDVRLLEISTGAVTTLGGAADEHGPSVGGDWVAWLDGAGAVRLRDEAGVVTTPFVGGAREVSLFHQRGGAAAVLALAVEQPGGTTDLAVVDGAGAELGRLSRPGDQVNPHAWGDWVAFEDLVTGIPQVALWEWSTGRVVIPSPSSAPQVLNDLDVEGGEVRLFWADGRGGDFDLYLFQAPLPLPEPPPAGLARCDDPLAPVIADFAVTVAGAGRGGCHDGGDDHGDDHGDGCDDHHDGDHGDGDHHDDDGDGDHHGDHGDGDHHDDQGDGDHHGDHGDGGRRHDDGHRGRDRGDDDRDDRGDRVLGRCVPRGEGSALGAILLTLDAPRPALACVDAAGARAAWASVGATLVLAPPDLAAGAAHVERSLALPVGDTWVAGVVLGPPGATVRVRLLADDGLPFDGPTVTCLPDAPCTMSDGTLVSVRPRHHGCSAGAGGLLSLVLAGLLLARPARRGRG
jgi:hypothetical protein